MHSTKANTVLETWPHSIGINTNDMLSTARSCKISSNVVCGAWCRAHDFRHHRIMMTHADSATLSATLNQYLNASQALIRGTAAREGPRRSPFSLSGSKCFGISFGNEQPDQLPFPSISAGNSSSPPNQGDSTLKPDGENFSKWH